MENKVLVKLIVPSLGVNYDVFIPVNEVIWHIKKMIFRAIVDLSNVQLDENLDFALINKDNGKIYSNNDILINTDVRNGTELVLILKKN